MADYLRVSVQGAMPGGEVWSVNPCFSIPGGAAGITYEELNVLLEAINDLVIPINLRSIMGAATSVNGARLELRSTSGGLLMVAEGLRDSIPVGSGVSPHPYQTSVVASLRSNTPGASGRGRLYWPATGQTISNVTLRIVDTAQATMLDGFTSYLTAINAEVQALDAGSALVVYSPTRGQLYPITRILIGDILDTQRRRRDAVAETYVSGPYAPLP